MPDERVLILNPRAGAVSGPEMAEAVAKAASERLALRVLITEGPGDARRFGRTARRSGAREVLVGGGDGTVSEVAQGFWDETSLESPSGPPVPTLSILPLGTGNDLARSLGIPLDWEGALELAGEAGRVRRLDVLEVSLDGMSDLAVNAVVVGSGGRVGHVLDEKEKERWGPLSYLRSAAEVVLHLEPVAVELRHDEGEVEALEALNVVVANGRYAARGVPIAPHADPGDGRMDLVLIRTARMTELLSMAPAILRGEDPDHEAYEHRTVETVRIVAQGEPLPVSVDGESRVAREIDVVLRPGRLPVRVPASGVQPR